MHCWWEYKLAQTPFIAIWQHRVKLKVFLFYIPGILLLRMYLPRFLYIVPRDTHVTLHGSHVRQKEKLGEKKLNVRERTEKSSVIYSYDRISWNDLKNKMLSGEKYRKIFMVGYYSLGCTKGQTYELHSDYGKKHTHTDAHTYVCSILEAQL